MHSPSSEGEAVFRVSLAMMILTALAVLLRILSRIKSSASFAVDDLWVGVSLVLFYIDLSLILWSKSYYNRASDRVSDLLINSCDQWRLWSLNRTCTLSSAGEIGEGNSRLKLCSRRIYLLTTVNRCCLYRHRSPYPQLQQPKSPSSASTVEYSRRNPSELKVESSASAFSGIG